MRRYVAPTLMLAFSAEAFIASPGPNAFVGRSSSYRGELPFGRPRAGARFIGRPQLAMSSDGGKVLVTGFLDSKERTDQYVFDILQAQGRWEKIVAFSDSVSFAKKRLISRKSRYSGLLDVLEFEEGDKYDMRVMEDKLQGISAWLCFNCAPDKIKDSVEVAKKASVKNMVISSCMSAADAKSEGVEASLEASGVEYTFIRVGEVVEGKEGGAVMIANVTDDLPVEQVVRDDIIRLTAEAFMMENVTKTAFAFGKGNEMALEYLKELRQNGTDRRTEMSTLIGGGFVEYRAIKEAEEAERNKPPPTEEELAEQERKFLESREEEYAAIRAANAKKREEDLIAKAQKEARGFLEREWNAQYWSRNTTMTLDEYIDDDENWERASEHAWQVMDEDRGISRKTTEADSEIEEDDDDDDDDDDDEEITAEGAEVTVSDEAEGTDGKESAGADAAGGSVADIAGKQAPGAGKTKKKPQKTENDVTKDISAESKDEGSDDVESPPQGKLDG